MPEPQPGPSCASHRSCDPGPVLILLRPGLNSQTLTPVRSPDLLAPTLAPAPSAFPCPPAVEDSSELGAGGQSHLSLTATWASYAAVRPQARLSASLSPVPSSRKEGRMADTQGAVNNRAVLRMGQRRAAAAAEVALRRSSFREDSFLRCFTLLPTLLHSFNQQCCVPSPAVRDSEQTPPNLLSSPG